jgi:DNA-binding CsgD family transcriptional regulator
MIVTTEQTSYGYRVSARGALRSEKADAWIAELRRRAAAEGPRPAGLVIDARGLTWDAVSASVVLLPAFRRIRDAGVHRCAVVTEGPAPMLELRRMAIETGVYGGMRFFAAAQAPGWERAATRWAAEGEDEPHRRQSERRAELADFLDALGEALVLCDLHGRVLHANPAFGRLADDVTAQAAIAAELEAVARGATHGSGARPTAPRELRTARGCFRFRRHVASAGLCAAAGAQLVTVERVVARPLSDVELRSGYGLTMREVAVARLLAQGRTNAEIGAALAISPFTARNHAERVMGKLGVSNRSRVAALLVAA